MQISELFDPSEIADAVEAGYVRVQNHPELPLLIHNYTERAQFERAWNPVTLQCRGLISTVEGEIIARPWGKFFNYGEHVSNEHSTDGLDLGASAEVTDKLDGSLGICYPTKDGWAIATRGSFASDQAIHATKVLRERYPDFVPPEGVTPLFEVIYPGNRIVVDYGGLDDLVLLGAVEISTGRALGHDAVSTWMGRRTEVFKAESIAAALALEPRVNAEGLVVRLVDSGIMIKIKQEDYVALHRLVTGLNARVVWERLGIGERAVDICGQLPDEFHAWVTQVASELEERAGTILAEARSEHERILAAMPADWTRKDYALMAAKSTQRPWLFNLLDDRDPTPGIWKTIKPSAERSLVAFTEDAA